MYIRVRAVPSSKKESIKDIGDDTFKVCVREPAERNLANRRIIEVIAERFGVAVEKVRLVSGARSRSKILDVETVDDK